MDKECPRNLYFYSYRALRTYLEEIGVEQRQQDTLFNEVLRDKEFRRRTCLLLEQFKPSSTSQTDSVPEKLENPIRNEQVTITEELRNLLQDAKAILKNEGEALDYQKIFLTWCIMQEQLPKDDPREKIQALWETYYSERLSLLRFVQELYRYVASCT